METGGENDNLLASGAITKDRVVPLDALVRFGFLDSALGGAGSDYAAVATVGRDTHGYLYVLDVWMERATPTRQVEKIFDLHALWNYRRFGFEANCFQSLLGQPIEDERRRRREAGRPWDLPIEQVTHRESKLRRIASLETLVTNGWLLFSRELSESFLQQCEQFPRGAHDDGLDALEAAVSLARRSVLGSTKPSEHKRAARHLRTF
jgi:predicted phage terminase large subunit-like protein